MSKERLVELIRKATRSTWTFSDLAEYLLANGVIVPPCKVGDKVYWIDNEKIKQGEVFEISIHSDGILVHTGTQFCLEIEQVFLTSEEAEKELEIVNASLSYDKDGWCCALVTFKHKNSTKG